MEDSVSKQHFKNLLSIAFADGILDKAELDFIFKKSGKYYIENSMRPHPIVAEDADQRASMMLDLIEMMCLDSEISEPQLRLCQIFGVSMGYSDSGIETMINSSVELLEAGKSVEEVHIFIKNSN